MHPFSFATTAQLICEPGSSRRLASLCRERGARSVLLVTDPGITRFGLLDEVLPGFAGEGLPVAIYDQVLADPPESVVLAAVKQAQSAQAD
ncbi:MAG: iron-containing alcohol dehydrogenase, partial [Pseudomonadaceae bacterium]